jgi:hypothetical protein
MAGAFVIIICSGIVVTGVVIINAIFSSKRKDQNERFDVMSRMITEKSIHLDDTARILNLYASKLDEERSINLDILREAEIRKQENIHVYTQNKSVLNDNANILKKIEVRNYSVRESTIWLYDHFKRVVDILNNMPPTNKTFNLLDSAALNLCSIENYFIANFGITPEEYKRKKKNISGRDNGGGNFITESSLN